MVKFSRNAPELRSATCGIPPPEIAVPLPKVVALPPGFVLVVHTVFFGQSISGKTITENSWK